ncbi:HD-GYP domain-containing protein [Desulfovibrio litoralis]|uniref:HDIG domain-containing protein n=1 Tax=Desulfovibrio litoralis DSM 11393 TaxID=1121455 RepID=A0A1M7RUS3_9BACT|nr:HD-GYP domain-containing protein [Desulfovibrio litoralis]SHN50067.1 HDIG domain-containing protein [Desulfovibrio litoralis DSM 11393]
MKKVNITDLKPGMYVVNPGDSWLMNPFLYTHEGKIEKETSIIENILDSGFLEVFIDLKRSDPDSLPPDWRVSDDTSTEDILNRQSEEEKWNTPLPTVPIGEEMAEANKICSETLDFVRGMIDGNHVEGEHVEIAQPFVERMLNSLQRNSNALLGLCKLRMSDNYTYTHCVNVAVFTLSFARGLGVPEDKLQLYGLAGLFHDIGKTMVPQEILNAPRKLTNLEFEVMKTHSSRGYEQLSKIPGIFQEILDGTYQHHEKYNGLGYPLNLKSDEISMAGKLMAVVDIYDALTSQRVYKPAMPAVKVLGIMYGMREQDFHPGVVESFIRMLGVYPVGTVVKLTDGSMAVVSGINNNSGTKPQVVLIKDPKGKFVPRPVVIELEKEANLAIDTCLLPNQYNFKVDEILKNVQEIPPV